MKKTFKKFVALLLTVLTMCSLLSVESFAALEILKAPVVESIKFSEDSCKYVSVKEMTAYYKEIDELLESFEQEFGSISEILDDDSEFKPYFDAMNNFDLGLSNFDYSFDVTLSDGKTYTLKGEDLFSKDLNFMYSLEVSAFVTKDEYLKAKNKGAKTVKVTVEGEIFSNVTKDYVKDSDFSQTLSIKTVKSVVKSISPVSGIPSKLYEDADYVDLSNAKFKISYADGTTKTAKVVQTQENKGELGFANVSYELDGKNLLVWEDEDSKGNDILEFSFLDAVYTKKISYTKSLIKSIKINSCDFDFEKGLSSISYTITRTDGKSKKYTKEFEGEKSLDLYKVVDFVDGYYVTVSMFSSEQESSEKEQELKLRIYVSAGEVSSKPVEYDIPYSDVISTVMKLVDRISSVISTIVNFITALFTAGPVPA